MEQPSRHEKQGKKAPRVPIQTYKWEDVRRSRLKGGYPWTYLYKDPFSENIDPEQFKMSESRSVSTLGKSTTSVDILELPTTPGDGQSTTSQENLAEPSSYIVITEVPSDLDSHSKSETRDSMTIQEINLRADSESSDNISQYLDKDESDKQGTAVIATTSMDTEPNKRDERSKSEEPNRKRKLSMESSYSRKSLSKLGILKKLKEAADKIKVPKLTLPRTTATKQDAKKEQKPKTEPTIKLAKPVEKPVYIHIPLKPPPGQTDEFSYLEFGEKKPVPQDEPEAPKSTTSSNRSSRLNEDDEDKENQPIPETETIEVIPPNYDQRRFSGDPNEIVAIEILRAQSIDLASGDLPKDLNNLCLNSSDPNANQDDVIIILSETEEANKQQEKTLSRQSSKRSSRKGRARSAEPERKRKLSLESSYSRKSLSKLAILQKLRDAKDKFKISNLLSRSDSKKQSKMAKSEGDLQKTEEPKKLEVAKTTSGAPKYIHIPLKPPAGQSDEFSYLEFEGEQPTTTKIEQNVEQKEPETPDDQPTEENRAVQFIVLTPPSDDEILDSATDVPETPTSEKQFEVEELKEIAKGAIERVSPESKKKLESVKEEQKSDDESLPALSEVETPTEDRTKIETDGRKIIVDEEDGLKSSEPILTKQEQELKSSLKGDGSPVLKKKVSFKRRSRDESKDGIYEDVEPRKDETEANLTDEQKNKLQTMGTSQSMSVDEEKSYLDEQKIIKTTSLEEDYNRWSKISDHEYEPVNPPPDNVSPLSSPPPSTEISPAKLVNQENNSPSLEQPATNQEPSYTIQEIQTQIEEKFFKPASTPSPPPPSPPKETTTVVKTETKTEKKDEPSRFQQAIKNQADKFKSKLVSIKKPTISMPTRPKFDKSKFEKFKKFEAPKFSLPKIPDTAKIHLPTFGTTRKTVTTTTTTKSTTPKRSLKQRQFSTESNVGDSKRNYFDFRTYPRIFKKKPKKQQDSFDSSSSKDDRPEFATLPRTKYQQGNESWTTGSNSQNDRWGGRDIIRVPLHGEESFESNDREEEDEENFASRIRYDKNIDIDDAYERENQEIHRASPFSDSYNSRWNHGTFHPDTNIEQNQEYRITDLDSPEEESIPQQPEKPPRDVHSSESSLGIHRRGVLEEIDSDEFFLRQKGISQDNIEVGMYLSSEIREAFKSPTNALSDLQGDIRSSNQSLPETTAKKKSIKKPKRKKTPHVSQEQLAYGQDNSDSEQFTEDLLPARPKRRSKRGRKQKDQENIIPYQETIAVHVENRKNIEESIMYENQQMEGKEQPEIKVIDPYADLDNKSEDEVEIEEIKPEAPPRRQRSLKSLNYSEHDSIMDDVDLDKEFLNENATQLEHEYIIPTPDKPPIRPSRLHSRSSSNSHDINREYINQIEEIPVRPPRTRSESRARSDDHTSRGGESLQSLPIPCSEEPCVQDLRDYMGYAIIDKQQRREPPLPPPRSSSRIKHTPDRKFFTVARTTEGTLPPRRPLRNYSTLGPNRPPRRKLSANMTDEEKQSVENLDVIKYIEVESDQQPNRDLNSGEILQKMRDRPLPAPPRPPRKIKHDHDLAELEAQIVEVEVSTQTEDEENVETMKPEEVEKEEETKVYVEKKLITPTHYSYEETITHGSLVVEPLNGAQILPDSELTKPIERIIPVTKSEYDDEEETSEIPEEFKLLKNPPQPQERPTSALTDHEVELVKTQKLQVNDLDVDRLSVNELMANKIIVSEIESSNLYTNEISSKSGAVRVGEIELPASVVQQLVEKLQSLTQEPSTNVENIDTCPEENDKVSQKKKTPIEQLEIEPEKLPSEETPENCFDKPQTTSPIVEEQATINVQCKEERNEELLKPPLESDTLDTSNTIIEPPFESETLDTSNTVIEPPLESNTLATSNTIIEETTIDPNIETLNEEEERLLYELKQEAEITTDEPLDSFQQITEETLDVPPQRPPRSSEKPKTEESDSSHVYKMQELEVDDEPPPRPPQPPSDYIPSQPPASFYALKAQQFVDNIDDNIPIVPRRRRHYKTIRTARTSSSDDNDDDDDNRHHHHLRRPSSSSSRRRCKSPEEPTIPQLTGQLINACCTTANCNLKRLIVYITNNYLGNPDCSNQDLNVLIVLLLLLIAGLILLGYGDGKTVHHHHWEYFNPPTDL